MLLGSPAYTLVMAIWPSDLPDLKDAKVEGYTEVPPDVIERIEMDDGPVKTRRTRTLAPWRYTVELRLTNPQKATFDAFFKSDILMGALQFLGNEPYSGVERRMRIVTPRQAVTYAGTRWTVPLELEVMP